MPKYVYNDVDLTIRASNVKVMVNAAAKEEADSKLFTGDCEIVGDLHDIVAGASFDYDAMEEPEVEDA